MLFKTSPYNNMHAIKINKHARPWQVQHHLPSASLDSTPRAKLNAVFGPMHSKTRVWKLLT
jgi:hypothetical protein